MANLIDRDLQEQLVSTVEECRQRLRTVSHQLVDQASSALESSSSWLQEGRSNNNNDSKEQHHLPHLHSLRGILAVMVVLHHAQCIFDPCRVFGPSAAMVQDIASACNESSDDGTAVLFQLLLWNPLTNGTFCACCFFCLSGIVLSHGLWKAPVDTWRTAVTKRVFRLVFCCVGAAIFSCMVTSGSSTTWRAVVDITRSKWLEQQVIFDNARSLMELPSFVMGAVWNGTLSSSHSGGILWTMTYELLGSYLTFGLVLLLKSSPHRIRTRWLAALFLVMLIPNATLHDTLETRVLYQVQPTETTHDVAPRRSIALQTQQHMYLLDDQNRWLGGSSSSTDPVRLKIRFIETPQTHWKQHRKGETNSPSNTYALDSVTEGNDDVSLDNIGIHKELLDAVNHAPPSSLLLDTSEKHKNLDSSTLLEMERASVWTTENTWLLLASFVAGAWIGELYLSSSRNSGVLFSEGSLAHRIASWALPIASFICASYPHSGNTQSSSSSSTLWWTMQKIGGLLGYAGEQGSGGDDVLYLWCTVGAVSLMSYLVLLPPPPQVFDVLTQNPLLAWLGRISFSLYLTHIPILQTITSWLFVLMYKHVLDEDTEWSSAFAVTLSLPVMLAVATVFERLVDRPSNEFSRYLGRYLLGFGEAEGQEDYIVMGKRAEIEKGADALATERH